MGTGQARAPSSHGIHHPSLCFYVVMTSQRELFPRLTADMRRFKKLPHLQRDMLEPVVGRAPGEAPGPGLERQQPAEREPWQEAEDGGEFYAGSSPVKLGPGLFYTSPLFPLLASEVASAQQQLSSLVQLAKRHCRRDNLWKRLFLLEPLASDKLKLGKLSLAELEELLNAVHGKSIADIDPQLVSPGPLGQGHGTVPGVGVQGRHSPGQLQGLPHPLCVTGLLPHHDGSVVPEPYQGAAQPLPAELPPLPQR